MVSVLHMLSYVGGLAGFLFVTLSLASGLLWMAELIEEHSRYAKTVGMRAIYTIITLHVVLYFSDSLPLIPTLFSIGCHLVYLQNFSSSWPYISLTSLRFLASCVLVVADHFTWFFHFAQRAQEQKKYRGPKYRYGGAVKGTGYAAGEETFMDVAAFFGVCVWFVPLFLFLSLSANDHALPSLTPPSPRSINQTVDLASPADPPLPYRIKSNTSLVKSILTPVIDYLPRLGTSKRRSDPEGIIAPRTPVRGSPLHTPVNMSNNYFPWSGSAGSDESSSSIQGQGSTRNSSPGYQTGQGTIGRGRPSRGGGGGGGTTPPPPRRVQSEMMTSGLNPRGIATRNGVPAVPDGIESRRASGLDEAEVTRRKSPMRSNTGVAAEIGQGIGLGKAGPSMSLGPERGEVLGDREVVETKGIAQPKRKDD